MVPRERRGAIFNAYALVCAGRRNRPARRSMRHAQIPSMQSVTRLSYLFSPDFPNLLHHLRLSPPSLSQTVVYIEITKDVHRVLRTSFHAGQHVSHYGDTGLPEPVNGLRRHLRAWRRRKVFWESRFLSSTHPEGVGIESKRKGRHGSPMRSKMLLKSLAAGYARR